MRPLDVAIGAVLVDALLRDGPGDRRAAGAVRAGLALAAGLAARALVLVPAGLEVLGPLVHATLVVLLCGPRPAGAAGPDHDAALAGALVLGLAHAALPPGLVDQTRTLAAVLALWLVGSVLADQLGRAPDATAPPRLRSPGARAVHLALLYWAMMGFFNLGGAR